MTSHLKRLFANARRIRRGNANLDKPDYQSLEPRKLLAQFVSTGPIVNIGFENGRPATIEVNGELHANPDATLDLVIDSPADVTILGDDRHEVFLSAIDPSTIDDVINITSNVIDYKIITGAGDDYFEEDGTFFFSEISGRRVAVEAGGGNDQFVHNGGRVFASMGLGDDLVFAENTGGNFNGGEGKDKVVISGHGVGLLYGLENGILRTRFYEQPFLGGLGDAGVNYAAFEQIELNGPTTPVFGIDGSRMIINKESAWYISEPGAAPLQLINFTNFGAGPNTKPIYQVVETSSTLRFRDLSEVDFLGTRPDPTALSTVVLGGSFIQGDTSGIKHAIFIDDVNSLVVSNSSSTTGHIVFAEKTFVPDYPHQLIGLTPGIVYVNRLAHGNLAGSNTANDRFFVTNYDSHLVLFGNGGDDSFTLGGAGGGLGKVGGFVNVFGGSGNDFIQLSDRGQTTERRFRIRESNVFPAGDSPNKDFAGLWHNQVEKVLMVTSSTTNKYYLSPAFNTQYTLISPLAEQTAEETFVLVSPGHPKARFLATGPERFIWWFGDGENDPLFYALSTERV